MPACSEPTLHAYLRQPTIHRDRIVFVTEDDLWTVSASGGVARRLTSGRGAASGPRLSPDGRWIAYVSTEEGAADVFVMPSEGGPPRRITWLAANTIVAGWTPDGRVVISTDARSPFFRDNRFFTVRPEGGELEPTPWGQGVGIAISGDGRVALCRHSEDLARWKRYRGGRVGVIWADASGKGDFRVLVDTKANLACPMWLGDRVFYLSDEDYDGNIWSCRPDGSDRKRHTDHREFYARHASTDGERIVYAHAADLYLLEPDGSTRRVDIDLRSPRTHLQRRFPDPSKYLEDWDLHPDGHSLVLTVRGKPVVLGATEGPPVQLGAPHGVRYRHARFHPSGSYVVVVSDAGGEEAFEVIAVDGSEEPRTYRDLDIGRPHEVAVSPQGDKVAFANGRYELGIVDLDARTVKIVDKSAVPRIEGLAWSSDGAWLAYAKPTSRVDTATIRLYEVSTGDVRDVTDGRYKDYRPSFDPAGKYLYFLSFREFDPVYDAMFFDLGFPKGVKPYAIVLQADGKSPFVRDPRAPGAKPEKDEEPKTTETRIDFDGLGARLVPFPVPEGRYERVIGAHGKVLLTSSPVQGSRASSWSRGGPPAATASLHAFDLATGAYDKLYDEVTDVVANGKRKTLAYRSGSKLRVVAANAPRPRERGNEKQPAREGWVDLSRATVEIEPVAEWRQMAREAWALMRDHFWTADLSGVDWEGVWTRYSPLLDRVGSRSEYSDLVWEMIGETNTSHAYEMMGDYRDAPPLRPGKLGADFAWDEKGGGWRVTRVVRGEPGDLARSGPLADPGVDVREGDVIRAVGGVSVGPSTPPGALLAKRAGKEVQLVVERGGERRSVRTRTLEDEAGLRYRDWVRSNRERVAKETGGAVGYVHVPDMGPDGFAEFHRDFLTEGLKSALIVDVRFNRGGHVSELLLEKLAKKPLGYTVARWSTEVHTYPTHAVRGPIVCLTNELAGSDGDIFSHNFKQLKIGPLVGKRTWGGVIGIWPRHRLVDGSIVTQPEFSNWYADVGWGLENYGTDPDVVVDIAPQDYAKGEDPQLARAIAVVGAEMERAPFALPAFDQRPYLGRPR